MKKTIAVLLGLLLCALALCACAKDPENGPVGEKILRTADGRCTTLNPFQANSGEDLYNACTQARLYRYFPAADGQSRVLRAELADGEPEQVDEEGLVWHVHVRDGLTFTDSQGEDTGRPIDAAAFEFTFRMALDPLLAQRTGDTYGTYVTFANAAAYYRQSAEAPVSWNLVGMKAVDRLTLEFTLEAPATAEQLMKAFSIYGMAPVEPELFALLTEADGSATSYGTSADKTYYSGGFYVKEWIKDSTLVLAKNPRYVFSEEVLLDGMELKYIESYQTQALLFEKGELDVAGLDAEIGGAYRESPYYVSYPARYLTQIEIGDGSAWYEKDENGQLIRREEEGAPAKAILANQAFKDALWYAVDRVTLAALEAATPANYIIPDTSIAREGDVFFYQTEEARLYREAIAESYDPGKAKDLFEEAMTACGYGPDEKLTLSLTIASDNSAQQLCAQFLQENLAKIFGMTRFELQIDAIPNKERLAKMKAWRNDPNAYDLALSNWSRAVTDESPFNVFDVYSSSYWAACNASYHCETVEKLIWLQQEDGRVASDRVYNTELAAEMEEAALLERIVIPLYEQTMQYLVSDAVQLAAAPVFGLNPYLWLADKAAQ